LGGAATERAAFAGNPLASRIRGRAEWRSLRYQWAGSRRSAYLRGEPGLSEMTAWSILKCADGTA